MRHLSKVWGLGLAATLFVGCNNLGEDPYTGDPIAAKSQESTALVVKTSLVKLDANNQYDSNTSKIADIIYAFANDDQSDATAGTFTHNGAYNEYINGKLSSDTNYTLEEFNAKYVSEYFNALGSRNSRAVRTNILSDITDKVKDTVVKIVNVPIVNDITAQVFKAMLNSGALTKVMLDQAINSDTITQIMIDVMKENWWLSEKMCPLLQEDIEFGQKFMELARLKDNMAGFMFSYIDAPMYSCMVDAMLLQEPGTNISAQKNDNADFAEYNEGQAYPKEFITTSLGRLMERHAKDYLRVPTSNSTEQYAGNEAFGRLIFNTGTTARGDGNELKNEKFFYAMFRNPTASQSFVKAMTTVDEQTVEAFLDFIFLGTKTVDAVTATDKNQSYHNLIAIAGGMYEGVSNYSFTEYTGTMFKFYNIIPENKLFDYGEAFIEAAYFYAGEQNMSIISGVYDYVSEYLFGDDETNVAGNYAPRYRLTDIPNRLLTLVNDFWTDLDIWESGVNAYDCYFNDDNVSCASLEQNVTSISNQALEIIRFETQDEINHWIGGENGEGNITLPNILDINISYVSTLATTTAMNYINGIDTKWLYDMSENQYVQEYVYGTLEENSTLWTYIPEWMTAMDWLKLPYIYTQTNYDDFNISFDAGNVDIYFVSTIETAAEFTEHTSLEVTAVDTNGDDILSDDPEATYYLYKYTVYFGEVFSFDFAAVEDYVSGIFTDETD